MCAHVLLNRSHICVPQLVIHAFLRAEKSGLVLRIAFPLDVVCKDDFHALFFQSSDPFNRNLSLLSVGVYTTDMSMSIVPFSNCFFASQESSIVAGITTHVDLMIRGSSCEKIDMAWQMTGCIDDKK